MPGDYSAVINNETALYLYFLSLPLFLSSIIFPLIIYYKSIQFEPSKMNFNIINILLTLILSSKSLSFCDNQNKNLRFSFL